MIPLYKIANIKVLIAGFLALSFASCSSYQYAGYDDDGIYSTEGEQKPTYTQENYTESSDDALYYKQLFGQKSAEFEAVAQNGIFTDIDSYSSVGNYEDEQFMDQGLQYQGGRPAWGSQPDEISINIYNDPFYSPFYGHYYSGFYGPYYGGFYGRYGHHRYGYNPYYGYGYHNPYRWNMGWSFGWNTWGYGYAHHRYPYYGSPYGHGGYYGNSSPYYYSRKDVAYNNSRRNSYTDTDARVNRYNRSNVDARSSRVRGYTNSRNVRAARNTTDSRTYRTQTQRVRSSSTPVRRNSEVRRSRTTREVRQIRNNRTRSNNSTEVRRTRSRSSSGNNGTYRSSSSSSRSSGTSSSSSRSRGGRGNN